MSEHFHSRDLDSEELEHHQDTAARNGFKLTAREIELAARLDHSDYKYRPQHLWQLHESGQLTGDLPSYVVPDVWRYKLDNCPLPPESWRELFSMTRYTADRQITQRPKKALRLFRGATAEHREGLSWTTDIHQADYFARNRQKHVAIQVGAA